MVDVAVSFDGKPDCELRQLDDGTVVPAVSPEEMHRLHRETIAEQVELGRVAEDLGYDYVAHPELHFSLLATLSPNPLMTQMAIAQATSEIRLLPGVVLEWHDPIRLAERFGMLDVVSDGRVDAQFTFHAEPRQGDVLGQYWGGAGSDERRRRRSFEEKFEILLRAWTETFLSYDGEFHAVPPSYDGDGTYLERRYLESEATDHAPDDYLRTDAHGTTRDAVFVPPRPVQRPHPPLWRSVDTVEAARWAARRGMNGVGMTRSFDRLERLVDAYTEAAAAAGWPDRRPEYDGTPFSRGWDSDRRRGFAAPVSVFNTDVADEETVRRWKRGKEFVVNYLETSAAEDPSTVGPPDAERLTERMDSPVVGSTDEIVAQLRRLREQCGYEDLLLVVTFDAHGLSTDAKRTQMESLVEDVLPRVE